jgi:hypothetical protein
MWFPLRGLGLVMELHRGTGIKGAVAVRIRPQLREKGGEVMEAGNLTAGAETPLELIKIRLQSSRKLGSEDVP